MVAVTTMLKYACLLLVLAGCHATENVEDFEGVDDLRDHLLKLQRMDEMRGMADAAESDNAEEVMKESVSDMEDMRDMKDMKEMMDMKEMKEELNSQTQRGQEMRHSTNGECYNSTHCCPDNNQNTFCKSLLGGKCVPNNVYRRCDYAFKDEFLCTYSNCSCCVDCNSGNQQTPCGEVGAQCRKRCYFHEYEHKWLQCHSRGCSCCKRCDPTNECSAGPNYGFCIRDWCYCNWPSSYISRAGCKDGHCLCCKFCRPAKKCTEVGGYCVRAYQQCKNGYVPFKCGCNDDRRCWCCVPVNKKGLFGNCPKQESSGGKTPTVIIDPTIPSRTTPAAED